MSVPLKLNKTSLQGLEIIRDAMGTETSSKAAQAAIQATVSMILATMQAKGMTSYEDFRAWFAQQQAARAAQPAPQPVAEPSKETNDDSNSLQPGAGVGSGV